VSEHHLCDAAFAVRRLCQAAALEYVEHRHNVGQNAPAWL
jgi:hypothetical protein